MTKNMNTPWSLVFDCDGTEDFGIICDADGNEIAASHLPTTRNGERTFQSGTFLLPGLDKGEMPVPVRQLQLMTAAPKLLAALKAVLTYAECEAESRAECHRRGGDRDLEPDLQRCQAALQNAREALAQAEGRAV